VDAFDFFSGIIKSFFFGGAIALVSLPTAASTAPPGQRGRPGRHHGVRLVVRADSGDRFVSRKCDVLDVLQDVPGCDQALLGLMPASPATPEAPLVDVRSLHVSFGRQKVLRDLTLSVLAVRLWPSSGERLREDGADERRSSA